MKTCVLCKHWKFDSGDAGYSEYTPGYDWESGCKKGYWLADGFNIEEAEYRKYLLEANVCVDYSEVEE